MDTQTNVPCTFSDDAMETLMLAAGWKWADADRARCLPVLVAPNGQYYSVWVTEKGGYMRACFAEFLRVRRWSEL